MSYARTGRFGADEALPQACPPGTTGLPQHCVPVAPSACPPGQMGTPGNCLPVAKNPTPAWISSLENFWAASATNKAIVLGAAALALFGIVKLTGGKTAATATPNRRRLRRNGRRAWATAKNWYLITWKNPRDMIMVDHVVVPAREQFATVSRLHQDGMLHVSATRYDSLGKAQASQRALRSGGYATNSSDLRSLGLKMHHWHSGMGDPLYAVGSYFVSGKDYPDRDVVLSAMYEVERLLRHPLKQSNLRELRSIHAGLRRYLASHKATPNAKTKAGTVKKCMDCGGKFVAERPEYDICHSCGTRHDEEDRRRHEQGESAYDEDWGGWRSDASGRL